MISQIKRKNIKILNFKAGHKRIDPILSSIRNKKVLDAKVILYLSKKKYSDYIFKFIQSQDDDYLIEKCYSNIGVKKRKIINMSHGKAVRQKSRMSHIHFVLKKFEQ